MHSAGQCSISQSTKHRVCTRTRKIAQEYTAFTGKGVLKYDNQTLQFILEYVAVNICQITPYFLCGLCSFYRVTFCSILRNENQRQWDLFSIAFCSGEFAQGFILGFTFVFSRVNGKLQPPIRAKKTADFIDRDFALREMNKDESKVKVRICSRWLNKVPLHQFHFDHIFLLSKFLV